MQRALKTKDLLFQIRQEPYLKKLMFLRMPAVAKEKGHSFRVCVLFCKQSTDEPAVVVESARPGKIYPQSFFIFRKVPIYRQGRKGRKGNKSKGEAGRHGH